MSRHKLRSAKRSVLALVTFAAFSTPDVAHAAGNGSWNVNGGGNWSDTTKWLSATVADGAGTTANFSFNNAVTSTVIIDGAVASRTVGTLNVGDTDGTNGYVITANGGGTLTLNNSGSTALLTQTSTSAANTISAPLILADNLSITNNSAANLFTISGGVTSSGTRNVSINASSSAGITLSTGSINNTGLVTNSSGGSGTALISAVVGANVTGVVQDSVTSQLTLSGANVAFANGVTVKKGTLSAITNTSALGTGTALLGDTTGTSNATLLGDGRTFANAISVQSGSTSNVLTLGNSGSTSTVFSGAITLGHDLTVTSSGTGSVNLSGVGGGITGSGNIILNGAGSTSTITLGGATVNNSGTITNQGASSGTATITRIIGANVTGVVQKSSTSLLSLSGNNASFTSGVTIKAGTVLASTSNAALGTGAVTLGDTTGSIDATLLSTITANNAINVQSGSSGNTLTIGNSASATATFSGPITLANSLTVTSGGTGTVSVTGGTSGPGNVVLNSTGTSSVISVSGTSINPTGTLTHQGGSTGTATISTTLGGNVTSLIQNSATSQLTLSGANTSFTGSVSINAGTLLATNASALNANNVVAINSGAIFSIGNLDISHAGLNDGAGGGGSWTGNAAAARALTLGGGGTYSFSGTISGTNRSLNVALTGSGSQTFSGNNNYNGATNVTAGSLLVTGTHTGGAAYTVSGTGTLGGDGSITTAANTGVAVNAGAKLSPGELLAPGTLTMDLGTGALNITGAVTAAATSSMRFDLDTPTTSDKILLSNAVTSLNIGAGVLNFDDFAFTPTGNLVAGTYTLFDTGKAIVGTLGASLSGAISGSYNGTIATADGGNDIVLVVVSSVVPEPATVGLLVFAAIGLLQPRRRARGASRS